MEKDFWKPYSKDGLQVISVSVGEAEPIVKRFREKHQLTYPVVADTEGKLYPGLMQAKAIPYNVIIDRQGIVRYSAPGFQAEGMADVVKQWLNNGS